MDALFLFCIALLVVNDARKRHRWLSATMRGTYVVDDGRKNVRVTWLCSADWSERLGAREVG